MPYSPFSTLPALPTELWLQILADVDVHDLWQNVRQTSTQLQHYADEVVRSTILPHTRLVTSLSLGAGSSHRWYDTTGTIHCSFISLDRGSEGERVVWRIVDITPATWSERALARWSGVVGKPGLPVTDIFVNGQDVKLGRFRPGLLREEERDRTVSCDWRKVLDVVLARSSQAK